MFNYKVREGFDTWRTFIECHYIFANRFDSEYWKYISHGIDWNYPTTSKFNYQEILESISTSTFRDCDDFLGPLFIAAGQDYTPLAPDFLIHPDNRRDNFDKDRFLADIDYYKQEMDNELSTYLFLNETIYK